MYLSDWCDSGECHNFAKVDRSNGRIYKIAYGTPTPPPADLDLSKLTDLELVQLQTHVNDWYVRHARRILQERFAAHHDMSAVHKALLEMFTAETTAPHKLRALWALHVTGGDSQEFLLRQLHHENEYVRGWAIQFLLEGKNPDAAVQAELSQVVEYETSPFVRLNFASGLQRMPLGERWAIAGGLAAHAEDADDHNLPLMLWYGVEPAAVADPARGLELAAHCKISKVRRFIARRIGDAGLIVKTLATVNDSDVQYDLLAGLHNALRGRRHEPLPAGWAELYNKLAQSPRANVRAEADVLALVFGDSAAADSLRRVAANPAADAARRHEAISALVETRAPEMAGLLQKLVDEPAMRDRALQGLAAYNDPRTPQVILAVYSSLNEAEKHDAVETLASRPGYAIALLDAVGDHQVAPGDISVFTARQLRQFKDSKISEKLAKVWGNVRESSSDKKEQMEHYTALLTKEFLKNADVAHGRLLFSHTCMQCHTLYGIGGKIGPDLTGSNRDHVDFVLQKVIDPSAAVPRQYQMQVITLNDGRLINGIVRERNSKSVVVQTDTQQLVLAAEDIEQMKPSKMSMMPERQFDKLTPEEIRDLLGYLATHSQVPLPAGAK